MKICDLHTHSDYSDGSDSTRQLVSIAVSSGIDAIALTDHNTIRGLPSFLYECDRQGIEGVAGVELSCDTDGCEVHILGLFLDESHYPIIERLCEDMVREKIESNRALVGALISQGYRIESFDEIYRLSVHGNVNRAHIAQSLIRAGYVSSISEAFSGILSIERGYYVPPRRIDAIDAISLLSEIGAVSVIAHPYLNLTEHQLELFLPRAREAGLVGMETYYPEYDRRTHALARVTAQRHSLLESGGSDYHGERKRDRRISSPDGFYTPYSIYEELKHTLKK